MRVLKRLLAKSSADAATGCWDWIAGKSKKGYGVIWVDGRTKQAHRVSYELHCGAVPDGMLVCHNCDNPGCINPDHLFLGTNADNMADMVAKGRQQKLKGTNHGRAKLTEADVLAIRSAVGERGIQSRLAKQYGVSNQLISVIRTGKCWEHI